MADDKKILKSAPTTSKQYSYSLGNVALNFTLRSDIKQERKDFLALLKRAAEDVEADLAADSNK